MRHVFIIGSKGIPASYGGFETFVEKLTEYQTSKEIQYHVACMSDNVNEFEYNGAECFNVRVPDIGAAKAVYYDIAAFRYCLKYIKKNRIEKPVVYVLACRIGPFISGMKRRLAGLGGILYVNPDGHEWKRAKWNWLIRKYWKLSERLMVKHADLLICDSKNIEQYIKEDYAKYQPKTTYIAYGCDCEPSTMADDDEQLVQWYGEHGLKKKNYYLVVGRFVPENNYETMIREFMKSKSERDFAIVTNVNDKFLDALERKLGYKSDERIKFVGTVYNQELLKKIRENAYGYFHGHEVGGTNPSLLEALGATDINMLLDVGFNREVAEDSALYWDKTSGNLAGLIERTDSMSLDEIGKYGERAKNRIKSLYSWNSITNKYVDIFLIKYNGGNNKKGSI